MVTGGKHIRSVVVKLSKNNIVHHKSQTQFLVATPVTVPELKHGLKENNIEAVGRVGTGHVGLSTGVV